MTQLSFITFCIELYAEHKEASSTEIYQEFDEAHYRDLKVIHFPEPTAEWLKMVCACRSNRDYSHDYDIMNDQIYFATEKALAYLRYTGFEEPS
ncbi:MAG: DUF3990 domain-containing protein [Treponema sp.]|jgi:hypothetical protein|nr:DUF3990 domain-containing protein [Treponema sp.]